MSGTPEAFVVQPYRLSSKDVRLLTPLPAPRARGLTLLSILALVSAPFSIPTFGLGVGLGGFLIVAALVLNRRGFRARGPLIAGIVSVVVGCGSAGACGWFVLRTAEVTGRDELRQDRVEDLFDRAFEESEEAPSGRSPHPPRPPASSPGRPANSPSDPPAATRDEGVAPDAHSPPTRGPAEERR